MSNDRALRTGSFKSITYVGRTLDIVGYNNPDKIIAYRSNVDQGKGTGNMSPITTGKLVKKQIKQAKDYFEGGKQT
jgi:hypothetical protein